MIKAKRGQLSGNVLTYAFSLVLIAVILVIGYKYFNESKETMAQTDLILLKSKLTSDIKSISQDYGSSKKVSYSLPSQAELCLFDLDKKDEILSNAKINPYPLIKDSINSDVKKNAFVLSDSIFESYYIGNIEINDPYFKCFKPVAGKVTFVIEGAGNKALILANT
ncbi:MAG: hypothetical protein IIB81_03550 [Nanoarchaeota archaeon]|nr:hypothetical protein [Nanoarchaeota archaeon]